MRNEILLFDEPQFQTSCLKETSSAHHLQTTIPKVKCGGSSLILWGCFSAAGTEGLAGVEHKLNAPKYRDSLNENPVQSIHNLRLGRRFYFQQDNGPKHTAGVDYRQLCECPWVDKPKPELEPKYFWRNLKMCICPIQPDRAWEVRRRIADNCQMLMSKACRIKQKRLEAVKGASAKYLVKGMNTYAMYLFQFLYL